MTRRLAATLLVPLLLVVAGCTAGEADRVAPSGPPAPPSPFTDCAALTGPPGGTSPGSSAAAGSPAPAGTPAPPGPSAGPAGGATSAGALLPDLRFACFTGGAEVALRELRGPAVLNLWASWCGPCRRELPAFQRLAERSAGRLHVVGVNTRDDRPRAVSVGADFGVTFPSLVDTDQRLQRELAPNVLPVSVFVDAQGRIRHQDVSGALDDARLAELVRRHLGLEVPA
ncbi:TlpA disulfide reductase family protein [Micromonospora sp. WMMD882]|uniref:TlpA family protein disulfide reductase n=1 Tax=Micromonospora sp. WMMD882 TaxID=3015151 RepID=UPI00248B7A52|nr:TlpA disulfide reductase family protein [Micromonospora sp. WMMD882]WBB78840.1 TlpA disulfide reductase family protein [Micromonospora sp. WMMD882]